MHPHRMVHRDITVWYFSGGTGPHAGAATPMIRSRRSGAAFCASALNSTPRALARMPTG